MRKIRKSIDQEYVFGHPWPVENLAENLLLTAIPKDSSFSENRSQNDSWGWFELYNSPAHQPNILMDIID